MILFFNHTIVRPFAREANHDDDEYDEKIKP